MSQPIRRRVLLDASMLLAAAGSASGASAAVCAILAESAEFEAVTSRAILAEVQINLQRKFPPETLTRLRSILDELRPVVLESSESTNMSELPKSVAAKDTHVIASCLAGQVGFCITLDRRHLLTEDLRPWGMQREIRFLSPGEFLAWIRLAANQ